MGYVALNLFLIIITLSPVSAQMEAYGLEGIAITSIGSIDGYLAAGSMDEGVFLRNTATRVDTGWANLGLEGIEITDVYPHLKSVGPSYKLFIGISVRSSLPDTVMLYCWDGDSLNPHDNGIDEMILSMDGFPWDMSICGETFAVGGSSIYRNAFSAAEWEMVYSAPDDGRISAVKAYNDSGWVFAGGKNNITNSSVVLFSGDKGDTWEDISPDSKTGTINSIEVAAGDSVRIYAVIGGAVIRTSNFGASWEQIYANGFNYLTDIVADPEDGNILYASGFDGNDSSSSILIRTNDGGSSWEQINEIVAGGIVGLTFISNPELGSYLYFAVSFDRGVFRIPLVQIGIEGQEDFYPLNFTLEQNYPNPFNPVTSIEYTLPVNSDISLIIYNLRGQEITRLLDGKQTAGVHSADWYASNFASGIYLYRLQASPTSVWPVRQPGGRAGDFVQTRKMLLMK